MKENKIVIKQVGYTYIFALNAMVPDHEVERIHSVIKQQLKEGCVVLPATIKLLSVEPHLEHVLE